MRLVILEKSRAKKPTLRAGEGYDVHFRDPSHPKGAEDAWTHKGEHEDFHAAVAHAKRVSEAGGGIARVSSIQHGGVLYSTRPLAMNAWKKPLKKALRVFHRGTTHSLEAAKAGKRNATYFTSSKPEAARYHSGIAGHHVVSAHLHLKNPYRGLDYRSRNVADLKRRGHDGILVKEGREHIAAAFHTHQIAPLKKSDPVPDAPAKKKPMWFSGPKKAAAPVEERIGRKYAGHKGYTKVVNGKAVFIPAKGVQRLGWTHVLGRKNSRVYPLGFGGSPTREKDDTISPPHGIEAIRADPGYETLRGTAYAGHEIHARVLESVDKEHVLVQVRHLEHPVVVHVEELHPYRDFADKSAQREARYKRAMPFPEGDAIKEEFGLKIVGAESRAEIAGKNIKSNMGGGFFSSQEAMRAADKAKVARAHLELIASVMPNFAATLNETLSMVFVREAKTKRGRRGEANAIYYPRHRTMYVGVGDESVAHEYGHHFDFIVREEGVGAVSGSGDENVRKRFLDGRAIIVAMRNKMLENDELAKHIQDNWGGFAKQSFKRGESGAMDESIKAECFAIFFQNYIARETRNHPAYAAAKNIARGHPFPDSLYPEMKEMFESFFTKSNFQKAFGHLGKSLAAERARIAEVI